MEISDYFYTYNVFSGTKLDMLVYFMQTELSLKTSCYIYKCAYRFLFLQFQVCKIELLIFLTISQSDCSNCITVQV